MTGAGYRWSASFGIFCGIVATLLSACAYLPFRLRDERLVSQVWFVASMLGVIVSLASLHLHPDHPDGESLLNHRAVGFIAVALNCWPWVSIVWLFWFIDLSPP